MVGWRHKFAKRLAPKEVLEDYMEVWHSNLLAFKRTRLIPVRQPVNIEWVGDASTSFGIGIKIGKLWSQLKLFDQFDGDRRNIAWLETVAEYA
ncbi:hypothetical protein PTTG_02836 [Puccinia triticina 1-1 BBBD Race 1]|uniref:Uncharacterized protein n=1 Tax=Puccinia triticina (isolate 1-1 / race 1 (BBBD)) TaxID=630390 RepID=A0A180G0R5_PUCT1|nr:hypothetical protein PTTG_02836 [Puccinia triticina 1-1 BBBD Race 1]